MINIDLTNEPNCIKKKKYNHTDGMGKNESDQSCFGKEHFFFWKRAF